MLSKNVRILDLRAWPDVPSSILVDLMGGEQSIISKVFGNTRCLQPHKPVTKAQAAAALTSGRMEEVIRDELNRLEAENQSQLSVMGEIMEELINRGDIKRYWEDKMKVEEIREVAVDKQLQHVLQELANEKTDREKELAVLLKERTALEHQNQELMNLRSEIDGMYDRLAMESLEVMTEEQNLEKLSLDVNRKHQAVSESKSYLEAEKEALTMLRSWVEEEAARVHERAEVLERAVRRWRVPAD
jgi:septal ring factor EnvC (AmiA/AmiB activator)